MILQARNKKNYRRCDVYDFFEDFFKIFFIAIPLAILGIWKLIEIIIFFFQHVSITIH